MNISHSNPFIKADTSILSKLKIPMKPMMALLLAILFPYSVNGDRSQTDFLTEFILGTYRMIGQEIGSTATYTGKVEIKLEGGRLTVIRSIGERRIRGQAKIETIDPDEVPVLRIRFSLHERPVEATCLIHSDLDNFARISCYLYHPDITTLDPGLEALFIDRAAH